MDQISARIGRCKKQYKWFWILFFVSILKVWLICGRRHIKMILKQTEMQISVHDVVPAVSSFLKISFYLPLDIRQCHLISRLYLDIQITKLTVFFYIQVSFKNKILKKVWQKWMIITFRFVKKMFESYLKIRECVLPNIYKRAYEFQNYNVLLSWLLYRMFFFVWKRLQLYLLASFYIRFRWSNPSRHRKMMMINQMRGLS